jgi:hypothetical protein
MSILFIQIDWEESANAGRVCVRPQIDEELDNRKHVYHGIDSVLVILLSCHLKCLCLCFETKCYLSVQRSRPTLSKYSAWLCVLVECRVFSTAWWASCKFSLGLTSWLVNRIFDMRTNARPMERWRRHPSAWQLELSSESCPFLSPNVVAYYGLPQFSSEYVPYGHRSLTLTHRYFRSHVYFKSPEMQGKCSMI